MSSSVSRGLRYSCKPVSELPYYSLVLGLIPGLQCEYHQQEQHAILHVVDKAFLVVINIGNQQIRVFLAASEQHQYGDIILDILICDALVLIDFFFVFLSHEGAEFSQAHLRRV